MTNSVNIIAFIVENLSQVLFYVLLGFTLLISVFITCRLLVENVIKN